MENKAGEKRPGLGVWLAGGIGILLLAYAGICLVVGAGVGDAVGRARLSFPGDPGKALIAVATSGDFPLKDRNRAIWALGQTGDVRAVGALEALLTGEPCDHASAVCQRELRRAIRQCRGGANLTRWTWRGSVL
jgi:hypothetical protein